MTYRINRVVRDADYIRHSVQERKYLDDLRSRGLLLEIDNILLDAEQLVLRTFQCNTNYCVRCTGSGSSLHYKGSCCTDLMVDITESEKRKLTELARKARGKVDFGPSHPVTKIVDRVLEDRYTEINESNEEELLHRRNGGCIMSWMDPSGQFRCSINTLVNELGLDIKEYKPGPCYLFPLHYAEFGADQYIVTVLSEETRFWIEQHRCVGQLRCLRRPEPGSPPAYQFLRGEIEFLLGAGFYRELDRQARPILTRFLDGKIQSAFTSPGK